MVAFSADFVEGPFGRLSVEPIVENSAVAAIGVTLVYDVGTRYSARPTWLFAVIPGMISVRSVGMFRTSNLSAVAPGGFAIRGVMLGTAPVTIVSDLARANTRAVESR